MLTHITQAIRTACDYPDTMHIGADTPMEDLVYDSIDCMEIAINLETMFRVSVSPQEIYKCATVGDIESLLSQKIKAE